MACARCPAAPASRRPIPAGGALCCCWPAVRQKQQQKQGEQNSNSTSSSQNQKKIPIHWPMMSWIQDVAIISDVLSLDENGEGLASRLWFQIFMVILIGIVTLVLYLYAKYGIFKKIPGIPHFDGYPIMGMAYTLPDAHEFRLKMIQDKGPVNQFQFFGHHFLMINEGRLAKFLLENIKGKGIFHVRIYP